MFDEEPEYNFSEAGLEFASTHGYIPVVSRP